MKIPQILIMFKMLKVLRVFPLNNRNFKLNHFYFIAWNYNILLFSKHLAMLKLFTFFKNSCELVFGDIRLYTFFKELKKSNDSSCFDECFFVVGMTRCGYCSNLIQLVDTQKLLHSFRICLFFDTAFL
jgi:hypothetical protein